MRNNEICEHFCGYILLGLRQMGPALPSVSWPVSTEKCVWVKSNLFQVLQGGMAHARPSLVSSLHHPSYWLHTHFPRAKLVLFQFPEPILNWGQLCSHDANSTFGCQSNPDLLPKSWWLGFCWLSWFPAPPACFLLFLGFVVILLHTPDRKPPAVSRWPFL